MASPIKNELHGQALEQADEQADEVQNGIGRREGLAEPRRGARPPLT